MERATVSHFVGGDSWRPKLWNNDPPVADYLRESVDLDPVDDFIGAIVKYTLSKGLTQISTGMLNPTGPYFKIFSERGFIQGPDEIPFMILSPSEDKEDIAYFANLEHWHLTFGDHDVESMVPRTG